MTRKEAIERIKNDIEFNHNFLADEYITALEMAIEALQQEPKCEDCKWNTWDNNCMVEYRGCRFEPKRESDGE